MSDEDPEHSSDWEDTKQLFYDVEQALSSVNGFLLIILIVLLLILWRVW